MSKKNPTKNNLRSGRTVYRVLGLGEYSYIISGRLTSKPYLTKYGSLFVDTTSSKFSLHDYAIVENKKTYHRAFFSRNKAKSYLERCKKNDIGGPEYRNRCANPLFKPVTFPNFQSIGLDCLLTTCLGSSKPGMVLMEKIVRDVIYRKSIFTTGV